MSALQSTYQSKQKSSGQKKPNQPKFNYAHPIQHIHSKLETRSTNTNSKVICHHRAIFKRQCKSKQTTHTISALTPLHTYPSSLQLYLLIKSCLDKAELSHAAAGQATSTATGWCNTRCSLLLFNR